MTDKIQFQQPFAPIANGGTAQPKQGLPAAQAQRMAADGIGLTPRNYALELAASAVRKALPPGIEVEVKNDQLVFSRNGEAFNTARIEHGQWKVYGMKHHGVGGHPDAPAVHNAMLLAGLLTPPPPPVTEAPAAPLPAVANPGHQGYLELAAKLRSALPSGIDVAVTPDGLRFSRNGELFYRAGVVDGKWSTGGQRQHGFKGHPDSPAVRAALKAIGIE